MNILKYLIPVAITIVVIVFIVVGFLNYRTMQINKAEGEYRRFLQEYENKISSLQEKDSLAYFTAVNSGKDEDYELATKLDIEISDFYMNKETFAKLKAFKESGYILNPLLKRQLDLQYFSFLSSMSDKATIDEIIATQNEVEKKFNTYRINYEGKELSDNEVDNILKTSKDSAQLKTVWEQSKNIGNKVSDDVIKLVKLRNKDAKDLGFENYQQMALITNEQSPKEIEKIFDDLDLATKDIYADAKDEIDKALAKNYGIEVSELQPWHYQNRFFQEVPKIFDIDMDSMYEGKDVLAITRDYYQKMGMPIDEVIEKSDLYGRSGKYQHAMTMLINREGDIRVVSSIQNNNYWMSTSLHEFAHAIYFAKSSNKQLPWELRMPSHTLTTEAVALLFQNMVYSPDWIKKNLNLSEDEINKNKNEIAEYNRLNYLIFSRWAQVMYRFEKAMYENPDQDLNKLWWDNVEKYQLIKKPEGRNAPDWASKIHISIYPVYYHDYMLGYLYAAQLQHYIDTNILKDDKENPSYTGKVEVGEYLIKNVFELGKRYDWTAFVEKTTGERLNPLYFAEQVSKK
ncbi:MAG: peptidase M3 [Candidatus Pacebacteria bacterium]|nr:peptidase M3 [Candidatus Paceibacterota bacterium]